MAHHQIYTLSVLNTLSQVFVLFCGTYPSASVSKEKGVVVNFSTGTAMKPVSHPAVFLNTMYILLGLVVL